MKHGMTIFLLLSVQLLFSIEHRDHQSEHRSYAESFGAVEADSAYDTVNDSSAANPKYDATLAKKHGADDYGMKQYILVLLKTGSNQTTDKAFLKEKFRGHLDNINRLVNEGVMIVAGPLGKNDKTYRGIFILNTMTIEEARQLLQTDPAVHAGILDAELYVWYGSAALPEYLEASDKVWKVQP